MDNSYNLCVLCCCSFGGTSPVSSTIFRQDLLNFFKILIDSPPQFEGDAGCSVTEFKTILDSSGLSICGDCHAFIAVALETRSRAEQMEMNVRRLQMQILEQLRALNSELDLFHQEMTKIESVVKTSDESCLMFHMPRNTQMERGNGVMVLRERILDVVTDLRIYQVGCTDTRLPVDESEVEAMWEDAQQLVQCTPDISMDEYQVKFDDNDSRGGCSGESEATTPVAVRYMGHSVGTKFHVVEESESDTENTSENSSMMQNNVNSKQLPSAFCKEDVIHRAMAREETRTPDLESSLDPLRKYYLRYDGNLAKLFVGDVEVIINEADETLQCSQCSIMGKRSKSNHQSKQSWRDMEKGILVHIIGKHLGGFQCQLCQEVFTSHTMIKKHNSKEHNGQTAISTISESSPAPSILHLPPPPPLPTPVVANEKPAKPYACSMCPSAFRKPSELKRHFLAKHSTVINNQPVSQQGARRVSSSTLAITLPQPQSPLVSTTAVATARKSSKKKKGSKSSSNRQSTSSVSGGGGPVEKVIPLKSALRPHECHICKYAFTKGSHLKRHLEVHRKRNELF